MSDAGHCPLNYVKIDSCFPPDIPLLMRNLVIMILTKILSDGLQTALGTEVGKSETKTSHPHFSWSELCMAQF